MAKVAAVGACSAVVGFAAGFRLAEHIYATETEIQQLHRRIKLATGVVLGAAAIGILSATLARSR